MAAGKALYEKPPSTAELAAFGFTPDLFESDPVEVWPCHWQAVTLFIQLGTQWRVGVNGYTGLDYTALFALCERKGISGDAFDELFDDIRTLEATALNEIHKPSQ